MYLFIPDQILATKLLNSDEKIVLAYIASLSKQGRGYFGSSEWLNRQLGLQNSEMVVAALAVEVRNASGRRIRPQYIEYVIGRWQLTPEIYSVLFGS